MSILLIIGMLLVGAAAGVSSAALGIGGGIIMVPAFVQFVPGMELHTAKGTSLLAIVFIAAMNAWRLNRDFDDKGWATAATIAAGAVVSAYAASWVSFHLSAATLALIFAGLVAFTAARLFASRQRRVREEDVRPNKAYALGIGVVDGSVSASAGVGGGIIVVPLSLSAGIVSNARVSGLSNMVMVPTATAAAIAHLQAPQLFTGLPGTVGQANVTLALLAVVGAQAGSLLGARINRILTFRVRRVVLVILLALVATRMLLLALHG